MTVSPLYKAEERKMTPAKIYTIKNIVCIECREISSHKSNATEHYLDELTSRKIKSQVREIVFLTSEDYHLFTNNLLDYYDWLSDRGGDDSHYKTKDGKDWITPVSDYKEIAEWKKESYTKCILVTNGSDYILVDPQGQRYAQYVGWGIKTTLSDILEVAQLQLLIPPVTEPAIPASFTCSQCPFARQIEDNRYCCTVSQTASDVKRGHWEATISCYEALAQAKAEAEKVAEPAAEVVEAPITQTAAPASHTVTTAAVISAPAALGEGDKPPNRGDNGRGRVLPIVKPEKTIAATNMMPTLNKQECSERPATPEEQQTDEVAQKFAEGWQNWNVFDTGYFLKYKRPYTLTKKQVDWLRSVYVKQFKWGESRDKAYDRPSMDNMGSTYQREFMWQVSVHANGSGTFEILVRK